MGETFPILDVFSDWVILTHAAPIVGADPPGVLPLAKIDLNPECLRRSTRESDKFQLPHNAPGKCTLMLYNGDGGEDGKWRLGSTFARPYCTLFNIDTNSVAFAKALH